MAVLTGDEKIAIAKDTVFMERVSAAMKNKAQYWNDITTPLRADVNRRMQKRKRMAKRVFTEFYVDQNRSQISAHWLAYYQSTTPVLDENGIPTYDTIFNSFDPTWDYFSGVAVGDDTDLEIEW